MEQYKNSMNPSAQPVRVDTHNSNNTLERKLHSLEQRLVEQAEQIQALTKELKRCKLKIDEHSNHINKIKLNG
jgi:chromosome segregation ATPase